MGNAGLAAGRLPAILLPLLPAFDDGVQNLTDARGTPNDAHEGPQKSRVSLSIPFHCDKAITHKEDLFGAPSDGPAGQGHEPFIALYWTPNVLCCSYWHIVDDPPPLLVSDHIV